VPVLVASPDPAGAVDNVLAGVEDEAAAATLEVADSSPIT
jgi:hypothetical protein